MMSSEHVEEFKPAVLNGACPGDHIRVSGRIKGCLDFLELNDAVLVTVKHLERLSHDVLPVLRKLAEDYSHEFLEINGSVAVVVENGEYLVRLRARAPNTVVI